MLGRNHLATGVVSGAFASMALSNGAISISEVLAVMAGSLLPDIDHPESVIGRRLLPISKMINRFFGHRGVTHSLWFPLLVFISSIFMPAPWNTYVMFLSVGILVHIFGDMMTVSGVPFFMPFNNKSIGLKIFKTGSTAEEVFTFALVFLSSGFVTWLSLNDKVAFVFG